MGLVQAALRRYARGQARDVAPWIVGPRVLDLGAGEGHVTAALGRREIVAVDVGPFRRAAIPYAIYDGSHLPFDDGTFDTTLVLLTLHHCPAAEAVLGEAVRVTRRRLIVTESVYRNRLDLFWLRLLDPRVNRLRHDGCMAAPLGFRGPGEWEALFGARGLRVVAARWPGSRAERLIHHPRLWVLDIVRAAAAPRRWDDATRSGEAPEGTEPRAAQTSSSVRAVVSPKRPIA
ncbi:MAG TPA: class I SAM-dependent methyltransferase [Methylomirabilota bacterium]